MICTTIAFCECNLVFVCVQMDFNNSKSIVSNVLIGPYTSDYRERSYVPRVLCSPGPMFPGSHVPRVLCSPGPMLGGGGG